MRENTYLKLPEDQADLPETAQDAGHSHRNVLTLSLWPCAGTNRPTNGYWGSLKRRIGKRRADVKIYKTNKYEQTDAIFLYKIHPAHPFYR